VNLTTEQPMNPYPGKRVFDLFVAGTACMALAPLAVGVAVATYLEDGGPALFVQSRIGRRREPFNIVKFRSMREGHVTNVGQWLRRTGIDELPQFVNVCRGQMSIVGPRPLTGEDISRLGWSGQKHDWRFSAAPGITGLAQLLGGRGARSSEGLERLYLRRQSFSLDMRIVALSFVVNILGKHKVRRWLSNANRVASLL
jgi:lipopolysaccharide/colanic/teichoic acid biosynthesis glycosyltransferase